ncbi:MAG: phytoene desaturase family protein [Candidatus Limnocylindrus sp.]
MAKEIGATGNVYDAIVIGGGHNGLVAAAYLARAGVRTLLVEARAELGGMALTAEIDGVRAPMLAHTVGRFRPRIARDLGLQGRVKLIEPEIRTFAPHPDGGALTLWRDPKKTAQELAARRGGDELAQGYLKLDGRLRRIGAYFEQVLDGVPPDLDGGKSVAELLAGFAYRAPFTSLEEGDGREILRMLPMSAVDLVREYVSDEHLVAVLAWRAAIYNAVGPMSPGTGATLLFDGITGDGADGGAAGQTVVAIGGPGALAGALADAARGFGAEIRTGASVTAITERDGRVTGVALANGDEIAAPLVLSTLDPKRTLLGLLGVESTGPDLRRRLRATRSTGVTAKLNLLVDRLPTFTAAGKGESAEQLLRGRIVIAPSVLGIEKAFDASKYGEMSETPVVEALIPTLIDPSLAPDGRHIISAVVQYAPENLKGGWSDEARTTLAERAIAVLESVAPGIGSRVVARQLITPADLAKDWGSSGGHAMHINEGFDQFAQWRPLYGIGRYGTSIEGLYLSGAGTHPGGGVTGAPGANAAERLIRDLRSRAE